MEKNLANMLSLLRIPAAFAVVVLYVFGMWQLLLIVWSAAWLTDAFDGMIARHNQDDSVDQDNGIDVDGITDSVLAFVGTVVPVVYLTVHYSYGWLAILVWIMTGASALLMIRYMDEYTIRARRLIRINMVLFHGLIQIGLTSCWFAYMATRPYGWWGATSMVIILVGISWIQLSKVRLWMAGALR